MLRRASLALTLLAVAVLLGGCLESNQTYTLNPDGSGKVTVETTVITLDFGQKKGSAKSEIRSFVQSTLSKTSGIVVWKDIVCKQLSDGKMYFKGTAYFRDIEQLGLGELALSHFRASRDGSTLTLLYGNEPTPETPNPDAPKLSEEEIEHRIDSAKQSYEAGLGMIRTMLAPMRDSATLQFSGTIGNASGFVQTGANSARIAFTGQQMLHVIDSVMAVPGFWRELVLDQAAGTDGSKDKEMKRIIFGSAEPSLTVRMTGQPLFNFNAEVAAAKKAYAGMLKKYGVKPSEAGESIQ